MRYNFPILLLIAGIFAGCTSSYEKLRDKVQQDIVSEIIAEVDTLDLRGLDSMNWDEMLVIGPYARPDLLAQQLDLSLKDALDSPINLFDSFSLLVFLEKGEEVLSFDIPRHLDIEPDQILIPKDSALFIREGRILKKR